MYGIVRSPGSCGEFIQGSLDGKKFLVTCPINMYSYVYYGRKPNKAMNISFLPPKSNEARNRVLDKFHLSRNVSIYLESHIMKGKGMASSSADISAVALATALSINRMLTLHEIAEIALSIEPSDATFYPEIIRFDYLKGTFCEGLGECPPMDILIFDEGGEVDTISFNQQLDLDHKISEKEASIEEALHLFKKGIEHGNCKEIGRAATLSAFANQGIIYKEALEAFHDIGLYCNSLGTIIAHSGTIMGLLFAKEDPNLLKAKALIEKKLPQLTFLHIVSTTNSGIEY